MAAILNKPLSSGHSIFHGAVGCSVTPFQHPSNSPSSQPSCLPCSPLLPHSVSLSLSVALSHSISRSVSLSNPMSTSHLHAPPSARLFKSNHSVLASWTMLEYSAVSLLIFHSAVACGFRGSVSAAAAFCGRTVCRPPWQCTRAWNAWHFV